MQRAPRNGRCRCWWPPLLPTAGSTAANGTRAARVATLAEGLLLTELRPRESFAPWYGQLRDQALRQAWIG